MPHLGAGSRVLRVACYFELPRITLMRTPSTRFVLIGLLRTSPYRLSRKFVLRTVRNGRCSPHPHAGLLVLDPLFERWAVARLVALEGLPVRHGGAQERCAGG